MSQKQEFVNLTDLRSETIGDGWINADPSQGKEKDEESVENYWQDHFLNSSEFISFYYEVIQA
jgi:hypothetical protein